MVNVRWYNIRVFYLLLIVILQPLAFSTNILKSKQAGIAHLTILYCFYCPHPV